MTGGLPYALVGTSIQPCSGSLATASPSDWRTCQLRESETGIARAEAGGTPATPARRRLFPARFRRCRRLQLREQVFVGPNAGEFIELGRVLQPQLRFDVFAVGFDRFHAEVELLGNVARAAGGGDELENLQLAIGQSLYPDIRNSPLFLQRTADKVGADPLAEINIARQHPADSVEDLVGGVLFHDIAGRAGAQHALGQKHLVVL